METRPRLRALYDRLEEREIELRTPGCKARGLHIHYNTVTIYGYLHLILARIQGFCQGGVQARLPENSSDNLFQFSTYFTVLQWFINGLFKRKL